MLGSKQGMLKQLAPSPLKGLAPAEVFLLVTGSVPPGSGLSSSSAMTTAAAITILELCGQREQVARRDVTEVAIASGAPILILYLTKKPSVVTGQARDQNDSLA